MLKALLIKVCKMYVRAEDALTEGLKDMPKTKEALEEHVDYGRDVVREAHNDVISWWHNRGMEGKFPVNIVDHPLFFNTTFTDVLKIVGSGVAFLLLKRMNADVRSPLAAFIANHKLVALPARLAL